MVRIWFWKVAEGSAPISSCASRLAVSKRSVSLSSTLPPGNPQVLLLCVLLRNSSNNSSPDLQAHYCLRLNTICRQTVGAAHKPAHAEAIEGGLLQRRATTYVRKSGCTESGRLTSAADPPHVCPPGCRPASPPCLTGVKV